MFPFIWTLGHFTITSYGLSVFLGILFAALLARRKNIPLSFYNLIYALVVSVIFLGIGAKLLYIIIDSTNIRKIFSLLPFLEAIEYTLQGGFVLYGGLAGIFIGLRVAAYMNHLDYLVLLDVFAPSLSLAIAIGRIGCFLSGCCYGIEYSGPFTVTYPENSLSAPANIPLFPTPLAESFVLLIITLSLLLYERKTTRKYSLMVIFIATYAPTRFFLEFLRGDIARGFIGTFSTSQIISMFYLLSLIIIAVYHKIALYNPRKY